MGLKTRRRIEGHAHGRKGQKAVVVGKGTGAKRGGQPG